MARSGNWLSLVAKDTPVSPLTGIILCVVRKICEGRWTCTYCWFFLTTMIEYEIRCFQWHTWWHHEKSSQTKDLCFCSSMTISKQHILNKLALLCWLNLRGQCLWLIEVVSIAMFTWTHIFGIKGCSEWKCFMYNFSGKILIWLGSLGNNLCSHREGWFMLKPYSDLHPCIHLFWLQLPVCGNSTLHVRVPYANVVGTAAQNL